MVYILSSVIICLFIVRSQSINVCSQDPGIGGPCSDNQTRWTFVRHFGCYNFQYSGCQGNRNNFGTREECLNICSLDIDIRNTRSKYEGVSKDSSLQEIAGGSYVNNKDKFPWFAFIRISFPHYTWRIWNPATDLERTEEHITKQKAQALRCGGIWISPKRVLTSDHCFYWSKPRYHILEGEDDGADPNHDNIKESKRIRYWRNVFTDRSTYKVSSKPYKRGRFSNVAIKLYGLGWYGPDAAHPIDRTPIGNGVAQPWWEPDCNSRSFEPVEYHPQFGGLRSERDIAILELHNAVTDYFHPKMSAKVLDLDKAFGRLQWTQDGNNEPIKDNVMFTQLGLGIISDTDNNPQLRLKRTNDLVLIPGKDCFAWKNIDDWTWDDDWYACYESRSQDSTMSGDSGGPGLTLVSDSEHPPGETIWRLHTIYHASLRSLTGDPSYPRFVSVLVGNRKNDILNRA